MKWTCILVCMLAAAALAAVVPSQSRDVSESVERVARALAAFPLLANTTSAGEEFKQPLSKSHTPALSAVRGRSRRSGAPAPPSAALEGSPGPIPAEAAVHGQAHQHSNPTASQPHQYFLTLPNISETPARSHCPETSEPYSSVAGCTHENNECTLCNVYLELSSGLYVFVLPEDESQANAVPPFNPSWNPNNYFSPYNVYFEKSPATRIAGEIERHNTSTFVLPPVEGNYCHGMNDIIIPAYWRLHEHQARDNIDRSAVQFLLHRNKPEHSEGLFPQYLALMSAHPVLTLQTWNNSKVKYVQFRELIAGSYGRSVHMNENYNYEPSRILNDLPFTPTQYAQNFVRFRSFLYNKFLPREMLAEPIPADKGYILVTNRKGDRRVTNPEELHKALIDRFGPHVVYPRVLYFEHLPLEQLARIMARARIVLAPHGAGISNVVYMRPGSVLIEMIPFMCWRLKAFFAPMAINLAVHYVSWLPTAELTEDLSPEDLKWAYEQRGSDREPCPLGAIYRSFKADSVELANICAMWLRRERIFRESAFELTNDLAGIAHE